MYEDTIAAISTPLGEGGIGIVRLSGPEALAIAHTIFRGTLADRRLSHGFIVDPDSGQTVDEVLASYMAAPHTYTREDVVEINCHGGPLPLQRVLHLALRHGARPANPGEFTLRAFLNGRIDLAQAESVLDVIRSRTQAGHRLAMQGLEGRLTEHLREVRSVLMSALAYLSARIDFPEDDIESQDIQQSVTEAHRKLAALISTADAGIVLRQGVRTAIVGRPNAGKSSLLNRLLRQERAIVTPIPGTTRDTVEEVVNLGNVPFILIDTAGITQSKDLVEAMGIERSRKAVEEADLVIVVIDASQPLTGVDREIMDLVGERPAIVAANKSDLPRRADLAAVTWQTIHTSALTGEGLPALEEALAHTALGGSVVIPDACTVTHARHKEALSRSASNLAQALAGMAENLPEDFISIDLTSALNALGEITGETLREDLIEEIFSNFCVGK